MTIVNINNINLEIDDVIYDEIINNYKILTKLYDDSNANLYLGFLKKSAKYYYKALEQNNNLAYFFLGLLYFRNDHNDAIKYFTLAIEHNKYDIDAIYYLARLYHLESNAQDFEKAKYYYLMATEQGDKAAMRMLERIIEDDIELYNFLLKSKKNDLIEKYIKKLENKNEIKIYKIRNNLLKYGYNQCNACLEDNIYVTHNNNTNYCIQCFLKEQNLY